MVCRQKGERGRIRRGRERGRKKKGKRKENRGKGEGKKGGEGKEEKKGEEGKGRGREEEREGKGKTERTGGRLLLSAILILGSSFNWPLMYDMPTLLFLYAMAIVQFVVISVILRRCHAVASGGGDWGSPIIQQFQPMSAIQGQPAKLMWRRDNGRR